MLFKIIPIFIGIVFLIIIGFYIFAGIVFFKGAEEIKKNGLKNLINNIWEGPQHEDDVHKYHKSIVPIMSMD